MNKKKLFILLVFVILIITSALIGFNFFFNKNNSLSSTKTNYITQEKKFIELGYTKDELIYINKLSDENIKKLETKDYLNLENYYTINNFNVDNYERYELYKKNKNNSFNYKDIVTMVNIGLDNDFYTNTAPALNQDKLTVLVNKYYYLDKDYVPENLVELFDTNRGAKMVDIAAEHYKELILAAKEDNITLESTTAYRSYDFQNTLYTNYVKEDGKEEADTYSARPGFSEHQTGLAVDLNNPNVQNKRLSDEDHKWIENNAHKYGFIMRYPKAKEYITGYMFESWHYRYVGVDIATYIYENNITYEEYYAFYLR